MDQAKLITMAPTMLMIALLGYLGYSVHNGLDELTPPPPDASKTSTLDKIENEMVAFESAIVSSASAVRDPFRTLDSTTQETKANKAKSAASQDDDTDPIDEFLKAMSLDATFVQGGQQIAIIDGKMYRRGQRIPVPASEGETPPPLLVAVVRKDRVYLRGSNKTYSLGYPEHLGGVRQSKSNEDEAGLQAEMAEIDSGGQLEFYKSLLNSPLGKMGKGLTGSMGIKLPPSSTNKSQGNP